MELALSGMGEELGGEARENAEIADGVLGERGDELRGHERSVSGGGEEVDESLLELRRQQSLEREPGADAARERKKVVAAELVEEPGIAGENDGEKLPRVEVSAEKEPELVEHCGVHLLGFVDEEDGPKERGLEMGLPAFAKGLGPGPSVVGSKGNGEHVAHLTVEVGEVSLRPGEDADDELGLTRESLGEEAKDDTFAGSGLSGDEREAAVSSESQLELPEEALDGGCNPKSLEGHVGREGVELEAEEVEQIFVHGSSSVLGR
jgi:hypothetical protein